MGCWLACIALLWWCHRREGSLWVRELTWKGTVLKKAGRCGSLVGEVLVARRSREAVAKENLPIVIFPHCTFTLHCRVPSTLLSTMVDSRHIRLALQWLHESSLLVQLRRRVDTTDSFSAWSILSSPQSHIFTRAPSSGWRWPCQVPRGEGSVGKGFLCNSCLYLNHPKEQELGTTPPCHSYQPRFVDTPGENFRKADMSFLRESTPYHVHNWQA